MRLCLRAGHPGQGLGRELRAAWAGRWQAGRPLASGLRSLPGSPSSFLTQATDKRFPSSHIWIMAFLTSCSGIETILFRWNGVNSSYARTFPPERLSPPLPLRSPALPQTPTGPGPMSPTPRGRVWSMFRAAHQASTSPSMGHPPAVPCPGRLLAVSRLRGHTRVPGSSFRRVSSLGDAELHM